VTGTDWDQDQACVLVVDDDAACGVLHARMLTDAGIPALVVSNGPAALEYARQHHVRLMLLDPCMPFVMGVEVLERLHGNVLTQRIPVMVLTGENETSALVQVLTAGADDSLAKPVKLAELVAHVRAIVRGQASADELRRVADTANPDDLPYALHEWHHALAAALGRVEICEDTIEQIDGAAGAALQECLHEATRACNSACGQAARIAHLTGAGAEIVPG
jgi:DNA-binding response OmpR family regulator